MPYEILQSGDKWHVSNSDTGEIKGEHDTEEEAKAQLAALYANVEDAKPVTEASQDMNKLDDSGTPGTLFIPLTKIDEEQRTVYGWGALEQPDAANEIMDYSTSKPHFMEWSSTAAKRSGGKSKGNVRSMHNNTAAGKLVDFRADDMNKGFYVGAKIVDQAEWQKVKEGVYTGFSIGGSYLRRWPDEGTIGKIRYTAKPTELSLVDAPCIPGATFQIMKADSIEQGTFKTGAGSIRAVIDLDGDELEKLDSTPVPTPEPDLGEKVSADMIGDGKGQTLQHMPPPNANIELTGNTGLSGTTNIPTTDELTQAAARSKELETFAAGIIKQFRADIKKIMREELYRAIGEEQPEEKQVKTNGGVAATRMIKVV